jgi:DNA-binding response OmpR family regulator
MATILIVDNDPEVVEACRLFLERERHDVASAYRRAAPAQPAASRASGPLAERAR